MKYRIFAFVPNGAVGGGYEAEFFLRLLSIGLGHTLQLVLLLDGVTVRFECF